jgi:hypothetical protein
MTAQSAILPVYIHLPVGATPPQVDRSPNRTVVIIEQDVTAEWQAEVSKWIVDSGCLYMMAWGQDCLSWDDSVDYANLDEFDYGDIPDDRFVMTTWHNNEPIEEVFWYCRYAAHHSEMDLPNVYIIHIAPASRKEAMLKAYWTELDD